MIDNGIKSIPLYRVNTLPKIDSAIYEVFQTGQIATGSYVTKFESLLQKYIGNPFVTTTSDVSTSLTLCLYLAGVRPGDEVIMSPLVCLATSCPVANLFANIRWCDVDPDSGNLNPECLKLLITKKTKAIIVYHWCGNPARLKEIYKIAKENNIIVIEDAGEAFGAVYAGHKIGNTGADFTVFSFYPNRHLTTIEGSAIAVSDQVTHEQLKRLKRYGIDQSTFRLTNGEINPNSDIYVAGWNSYLNNVAAAIGVQQMVDIERVVDLYKDNGKYYTNELADISGIKILQLPENSCSSYWVYSFLCDSRDLLMEYLKNQGIGASQVHLRNDLYSCFGRSDSVLRHTEIFSKKVLSIPCGWWVTNEQRQHIVNVIRDFMLGS